MHLIGKKKKIAKLEMEKKNKKIAKLEKVGFFGLIWLKIWGNWCEYS